MKKVFSSLFCISFLSMLLVVSTGNKAQAQDVTVSYQTFYDELSPYGQWVYDPEYGNVWVPNEDGDFRPYGSRGQWVMTDYGNTWVSDDPWGWACYHYGRWTYNGYYGWIWVPGYEWAPAWVSWRYGGGYAGWAPMAPGYSVGVGYGCPDSWWVFVGPQYLYRHDYYNYWRGPAYNRTYINQTTIINNVYVDNSTHVQYNYGPRASTIEATTHAPVQVYRVSQGYRPGSAAIQQNTVNIYRPNVNRNSVSTARPTNVIQAPRNIGRPEAAAANNGTRQPVFRQEIQRQNSGNTGFGGPRNNNNVQPTNRTPQANPGTRFDQHNPQPQQPVRQEPQRNYTEPQRVNPQQPNRPEPQHFTPQPQQQQPVRQEPQRTSPEPQRYNPQPQQPQRSPEPQRYNPQPQPQQPRPQPQMQQPRPQPAPAPARQAPQEERGGRR